MIKKQLLSLGFAATSLISTSSAAISWTGLGDGANFQDDSNWDFSGSSSTTMASPTDDDIFISSSTISDPGGTILLGDNFTLTLDNSNFSLGGGAGFTGVNDASDDPSSISLINGSALSMQFVSVGVTVNVDGTSSITFGGGGDPINSQQEQSNVNIATGGQLVFSNTGELSDQLNDSGSGDIFVNNIRVTALNANTLLTTADSLTYTAVPEPSSSALLGLAGIALILRRRK